MTTHLIINHGKVLAGIDHSVYAESVVDHACWAAQRLGAPLQFLHALDGERAPATAATSDLSGNLDWQTQSMLLDELVELDRQRSRIAAERGRELLRNARKRAQGLEPSSVDALQRHGSLVEALTELESGVRLFVLGKRGETAQRDFAHLGTQLERAVRAVQRPLLVASRAFRPIQRFAIAFDASPTARKCVDMVAASPLFKGLPCHLITGGKRARDGREAHFSAKAQLESAGFEISSCIEESDAEALISDQVREQSIDLLVMGAYGHSRIRHLIVGSTTSSTLRSCQIPVLLLR